MAFDNRPIVDYQLEQDIDRAGMIHQRRPAHVSANYFGRGPKGYNRSDEKIREDVCEALYLSRDIDASELEVSVKQGKVFLTGSVENRKTKRMVEDTVERIGGVLDISNELHF